MSVAAFFRDAKVQEAIRSGTAGQAASLVQDFFAQYDYGECSPLQLIALSDLATRGDDLKVARSALERVARGQEHLPLAQYKLGRLDLRTRKFQEAAEKFQAGIAADAGFVFNWMGLTRALHAQGRKDEALIPAERFISFGVAPHSREDSATLGDLGDFLFDRQDRAHARVFYEGLIAIGTERPRDVVRLAECLISANDYEGALRVLQTQDKRRKLDLWGRRALAFCLSQTGEHAQAISIAEGVLAEDPSNAGFLVTYLDVLNRSADSASLRDALDRNAALLGEAGAAELRARLHVSAGDIPAAAEVLAEAPTLHQTRLYYLTFETAYAALGAGLLDVALALGDKLGAIAPDDSFVKLLRIDIFFRQQLWERAGRLLASMTEEERRRPHVVLKRFEHACFTADLATAEALRAELEAMALPNRQFMLPIFRYLAEQGEWQTLVDRALTWLDTSLNYPQIGYVLFRAAKHTGRGAELVAAVEAIGGWETSADLVKLRANLLLDLADSLPALAALATDPTIANNELLRRKISTRHDVLARALARRTRRAVFLCSDRNYLCATIVALHNLSELADLAGTDFYVVVDDDIAAMTERFTTAFTAAGMSLRVVPASSVVQEAAKLYPAYGLFTSGHMLSQAAYYRIYFARHLQQLGRHDRALYVDSDIFLRTSLDGLFLQDMADKPLMARLENMRPDVRRAITLHKLTDNRYFNSGVLLFDLRHPDLTAALDRTVAAIMDDGITLLYHDQCALNLGFRAHFADLDRSWNYPVVETTKLAAIPADAGILHFLDRPKPWSAAYGGEATGLWHDRWRRTAAFIGETQAVELFAQIQD